MIAETGWNASALNHKGFASGLKRVGKGRNGGLRALGKPCSILLSYGTMRRINGLAVDPGGRAQSSLIPMDRCHGAAAAARAGGLAPQA
jgi:hypothetical protein